MKLDEGGEAPLPPDVVARLREEVPVVAQLALAAVTGEVPEYAGTLSSEMSENIEAAIATALRSFLRLVVGKDADAPLDAARKGAYDLGRGEARTGRTADALLAAYRVGARVSWRELSSTAVADGTSAAAMSRFAELVFAYIDELSAASVAGHADELAASGRLRQQRRDQLGRALIAGAPTATLIELAQQAAWPVPQTLTAVLLPSARVHDTLPHLDRTTLNVPADAVEPFGPTSTNALLVSDAVRTRTYLLRLLSGRRAVVGPPRRWTRAEESLRIGARAHRLLGPTDGEALDTTAHLATLVVAADPGAVNDLQAAALEPMRHLKPATAERLGETLRAWLLHLGRRSDVADALHVHPQTVRYRMTQIRELYGDRLEDPDTIEALIIALALPPGGAE